MSDDFDKFDDLEDIERIKHVKEIKHIGVKMRSGRYPYGSGKDPAQHTPSFLTDVRELRRQGFTNAEIAKDKGMSVNKLNALKSIERNNERRAKSAEALRLLDKGYSHVAIGKRMNLNESSVRSLLDPVLQARADVVTNTSNMLREHVDKKKYIDVGSGVEVGLGVHRTKLDTSIEMLKEEGYNVYTIKEMQKGTGKNTTIKALCRPEVTYGEFSKNRADLGLITDYSKDEGKTYKPIEPPQQINSNRIHVRYDEEGGSLKDGMIELRRGVPDISLGDVHYAQVRIGVDGTHFMKGMAVYSDDIPEGKDIVYNVNKKIGASKDKIFKPIKDEPDNPFGASISQRYYKDENGVEHLSAINKVGLGDKVNEEGAWANWSRSLSSQVMSKQLPAVAQKQLKTALELKKDEFDELKSLTNQAVKKRLLETFADGCDSAAVDLKAAALPRQASQVLISIPSSKKNEIYAPRFTDGENVVLIRHPHGGIFEIPELIVNNKNKEAIKVLGKDADDAVGIHPSVAEKLSGADFDGDTVIVIPNRSGAIKTAPSLRALKNFSPKTDYALPDSAPKMTPKIKAIQMGNISNLITDMTIKGANEDEIARAVKHSMVVIDAEKHHLDYKRSAKDNNIAELKQKYQGGALSGASTVISKAGSEYRVPARKDSYTIDPQTGKKIYQYILNDKRINKQGYSVHVTVPTKEEAIARGGLTVTRQVPDAKTVTDKITGLKTYKYFTGETYVNGKGKLVKASIDSPKQLRVDFSDKKLGPTVTDPLTGRKIHIGTVEKSTQSTTKSTKMAETDDAFSLSSGTRMERIYAQHANDLKDMGNQARKLLANTGDIEYSPSAFKTYRNEVDVLKSKLANAYRNKPLERKAQLLAGQEIRQVRYDNPDIDAEHLKKATGTALIKARAKVGAQKEPVLITDKEWEAIQAGAVSNNTLVNILQNTDLDSLKERALPRESKAMSPARVARARSMIASGERRADIAEALGVSIDSIDKALE